ncbi:MAG: restriction endonuclease subunit S, partial [Candidatus Bathyarchaeia archaeon]
MNKIEFYKETEFKETPMGKMPKDWKLSTLGEVAKIRRGASPRPKSDPRYFGGSIPWVKISDLAKYQQGFYLIKTDDTVTEEGKKRSVYLDDGALIISNSGTIGRPAIIYTGKGGCIHDGFISVEPNEVLDKYFLFY